MGAPQLQPVQRMNDYDMERFEIVMRMLFGDTMTEEALDRSEKETGTVEFSQHLAWSSIGYVVEAGTKEIDPKKCFGVRTYKSLFYHAQQDKAVFFTPNTLCSRTVFKKDNEHMRWINAIVVDIDELISLEEVLKRIQKAKLPAPTAINKTPDGWHVYWILKKRIEGWYKSNRELYRKIAKAIQVSIGGDPFAKSVSNYFRIPKDIQFLQEDNRFTMLKFKNWYKKALETNYLVKESSKVSLMEHSAIIEIKKGVSNGDRNIAAYSLAKVYQYEGISEAEALSQLTEWNKLNVPSLSERELNKRIKSAYNGDNRIPLNYIYNITGIKMNIGTVIAFRNHKKVRSERKNSHFEEIIDDLFFYLKKNGDFFGSQSELAKELKESSGFDTSERSLKEVIKQLKNGLYQDQIKVEVFGKGRGSKTKVSLFTKEPRSNDKCTPNAPQLMNDKETLLIMYPNRTPDVPQTVNGEKNGLLCTPNVPQQLRFQEKCGQLCTTIGVQTSKNLKQKSKKIENEVYSSNKVISMPRVLERKSEEMVQAPNNHYARMVGTASKMPEGLPLECGYQYFHEVHSEVLTVDAVDPCGNVDNRRPACGRDEGEGGEVEMAFQVNCSCGSTVWDLSEDRLKHVCVVCRESLTCEEFLERINNG